jgi:tetratricopeptide (TPR) repeat protein
MKRVMSTFNSASEAHRMSEEFRENDKHEEALQAIEIALVQYQKEKNYLGFAKALQSRVLIYKHLFFLTNDIVFAILARNDAKASLQISQDHKLKDVLSSCYFRLGEVANLFKEYGEAVKNFQKSLEVYVGTNTERGDFRYHLGEAIYRNSEKEKGIQTMLEGLSEIQKYRSEVDPFLANVWESGCYMKLAELLKEDDPVKAREYLSKAQGIVDADDKLVIRKRQVAELAKNFD